MTAVVLDGKGLADKLLGALAERVRSLRGHGCAPRLVVIRVGDDAASAVYVGAKLKACERIGIQAEVRAFPAAIGQANLMNELDALNADSRVHGVIVQLPLPRGFDAHEIANRVLPAKDVDGFHACNLGRLLIGQEALRPCTPKGVIRLLDHYGVELAGRHAVVVGRSEIVGKPMAMLLINRGATVTVCNSRTSNLPTLTHIADVVVSATGRAGLITDDMVKPGAVVVDVGITRLNDGRLAGDVSKTVAEVAGFLTPVPGGVGPMTVAMLLENTVSAAERTLTEAGHAHA